MSSDPTEAAPAEAHVLVVDDDAPSLVAVEAVLEPLGVKVTRAMSGPEALAHLAREDFAAVLLDVELPGLDGFETAAEIRRGGRNREAPVLFMSALHRDEASFARGYAVRAVDYLHKPLDPDVLRAKVAALVDLWRRGESLRRREAAVFERERASLLAREREARAEAEAERRRLHAVLMQLPAAVAIVRGPDHVYELSNPVNDRLAGRPLPVGKPVREAAPDLVAQGLVALVERVYQTGDAFVGEEIRVRVDPGDGAAPRELIVNGSYQPLRDASGRVEGVVAFAYEVTAQVRARERAEALAEELRQSEARFRQVVDEFLAVLSHELRTPLTAILGWSRMLAAGALRPEDRARAVDAIDRNATVQVRLIEDLLDFSRILADKLTLRVEPVRVRPVIEAALDAVRPAAAEKGVRLEPSLDDSAAVLGDAARLQQVAWNLLANAVKFTPAGASVTATLRRDGGEVELSVCDTGAGIDPAFLPFVFDRFRQGDSSRTRAHGGLGLGLAIVRHLVELHGGRIEARSEGLGRGATFVVRLPTAPGAPSRPGTASGRFEAATSPALACPPELAGLRVLVVEDEADSREVIRWILERCRALVTTAPSAAEALERFREAPPDVLVCDIGMPGEDGYSLLRKVRALAPERGGRVPALALTGYARAEDRTAAEAAGFTAHAAKPIQPHELLALVASIAPREAP